MRRGEIRWRRGGKMRLRSLRWTPWAPAMGPAPPLVVVVSSLVVVEAEVFRRRRWKARLFYTLN